MERRHGGLIARPVAGVYRDSQDKACARIRFDRFMIAPEQQDHGKHHAHPPAEAMM